MGTGSRAGQGLVIRNYGHLFIENNCDQWLVLENNVISDWPSGTTVMRDWSVEKVMIGYWSSGAMVMSDWSLEMVVNGYWASGTMVIGHWKQWSGDWLLVVRNHSDG